MSISNLSVTLQKELLQKLIDKVSADLKTAQNLSKVTKFDFATSTTTSMLRDITDRNQIGILARSTIDFLAKEYSTINKDLLKKSGRVYDSKGALAKSAGLKNLKSALGSCETEKEVDLLIQELGRLVSNKLQDQTFWTKFIEELPKDLIDVSNNSLIQLKPAYHGTFLKLFINYTSEQSATASITSDLLADFLSSTLDTGHLLGIFNQRLIRSIGSGDIKYNSNIVGDISATIFDKKYEEEQQYVDTANKVYTAALGTLEQLDFLSSQLVFTPDIFIKLSKTVYAANESPTASAEFQLSFLNSAAGREISAAGRALSDLMNKAVSDIKNKKSASITYDSDNTVRPKSIDFANKLEEVFQKISVAGSNISSVIEDLISKAETEQQKKYLKAVNELSMQFGQTLLETKGSDSILESVGTSISYTLKGKKFPSKQSSKVSKNTKASRPVYNKVASKQIKLSNNKKRTKVSSIKSASLRNITTGRFYSLTSLQTLLDANLVQQIKQNMGDGSRRDILNLRSGRFAESVKVERLSQSREGMITAFYSYMKNPYATFSRGGQQERPYTRDPKLLIAKSIREIASQQVANRLRAVNV
jgi:hypothetical protein